ncbi:hypothetical protein [uncultured Roseobacter sp.]|nr:hypothetical protein [uncultured Roseobacter sp.]
MHNFGTRLVAVLAYLGTASVAVADEPLIAFKEDQTFVACDFANHAITAGYFQQIKKPRITGTCPEPAPDTMPTPVVNAPIVPKGPPIAPWCDCTDDEWRAMEALMTTHRSLVNPGYKSADPVTDWAKSFGTDTATIQSPEFWSGGSIPEFDALSGQRFLTMK